MIIRRTHVQEKLAMAPKTHFPTFSHSINPHRPHVGWCFGRNDCPMSHLPSHCQAHDASTGQVNPLSLLGSANLTAYQIHF